MTRNHALNLYYNVPTIYYIITGQNLLLVNKKNVILYIRYKLNSNKVQFEWIELQYVFMDTVIETCVGIWADSSNTYI